MKKLDRHGKYLMACRDFKDLRALGYSASDLRAGSIPQDIAMAYIEEMAEIEEKASE